MELLAHAGILGLSLFLLIQLAHYFTVSAEKVGKFLGLSSFLIGVTIVSIGSSLPELITSIFAIWRGMAEFPIDNVIGSNIANCLLVGGAAALAGKKFKESDFDPEKIDFSFLFLASGIFVIFLLDGVFSRFEGFLSFVLFGIFLFYTICTVRKKELLPQLFPKKLSPKSVAILFGSAIGIYFAAKYTVISVENITQILRIESAIITMLVVAIGTSLPELVVSVRAAAEGKHSIAIGNIFGSNIFNILAIAGIPSLVAPLALSSSAANVGLPFFALATLAFIFKSLCRNSEKLDGAIFLVIYGIFCAQLVGFL